MVVGTIKKDKRQILKEIRGFSEDTDWISEKQTMLRKKFADKYIAVVGRQVIDSDSELETLLRKLQKEGRNPSEIPIEFISKEPLRLVL